MIGNVEGWQISYLNYVLPFEHCALLPIFKTFLETNLQMTYTITQLLNVLSKALLIKKSVKNGTKIVYILLQNRT